MGGLRLAVIIPVLDEAGIIDQRLDALTPLRRAGHRVIVVDGGSSDGTADRARPFVDPFSLRRADGRGR